MEIKKVYASLQMDMTIETENSIQQFLLNGKSKSKRKHNYSLSEFGLDDKNIRDQFRDYMLKYGLDSLQSYERSQHPLASRD